MPRRLIEVEILDPDPVLVPDDDERLRVRLTRSGFQSTEFRLNYAEGAELRNQLNARLSQLRKEMVEG